MHITVKRTVMDAVNCEIDVDAVLLHVPHALNLTFEITSF